MHVTDLYEAFPGLTIDRPEAANARENATSRALIESSRLSASVAAI